MKSIFLPFYYDSKNLNLIVLETFDKPIRYFDSPDNSLLKSYQQFCPGEVKSIPDIILDERFSWTATYKVSKVDDKVGPYLQKYNPAFKFLSITKLEDIYTYEMPAELRIALLSVVTKELSENDNQLV